MLQRLAAVLMLVLLLSPTAKAEVTFEVTLPSRAVGAETGRLVVYVVDEDGPVGIDRDPADGPYWREPEPIFGTDVADWQPGSVRRLTDAREQQDGFRPNLPPGRYKAQAVLDSNHLDSNWKRENGNLWGETVTFEVVADRNTVVPLTLDQRVDRTPTTRRGEFEVFEIESKLMPGVTMKAGVLPPRNFDPARQYPAIYLTPGFGGTHTGAMRYMRSDLRDHAFIIGLNPESKNGHTLFNDSAVNGPRGQMLVEELIPALEAKYPLITEPAARIVTGHSSGGWSSLWLATEYPETFGACWSSGPDPVDFRRFELVDIYASDSFFVAEDGSDFPSCRYDLDNDGVYEATLTVRQETYGENVLGPNNTSGQQFDSWMACWGGDDDGDGFPNDLFDPITGDIDPEEAEHYKKYDIRLRLAEDPERFGPIFASNIRLVCGELDNYYLNEAVVLLQEELAKHDLPEGPGYVKMIAGADHGGSLFRSGAMRSWTDEMIEHLRTHDLAND